MARRYPFNESGFSSMIRDESDDYDGMIQDLIINYNYPSGFPTRQNVIRDYSDDEIYV